MSVSRIQNSSIQNTANRVYLVVVILKCDIIELNRGQLSWATKEVIYE